VAGAAAQAVGAPAAKAAAAQVAAVAAAPVVAEAAAALLAGAVEVAVARPVAAAAEAKEEAEVEEAAGSRSPVRQDCRYCRCTDCHSPSNRDRPVEHQAVVVVFAGG
jgi:hypothetical protein